MIEALANEPSDAAFVEAENAVHLLENTVRSSKAFKEQDQDYARFVASADKQAKAYRGRIAGVKRDLEVNGLKKRVETALATANERMSSLEDEAALRQGREALSELKEEIKSGAGSAKKDKGLAKYLAQKSGEARGMEKRLNDAEFQQEFGPQEKKVQEARAALAEKVRALKDLSAEAIEAAESAAGELESALEEGDALAERSPKYAKFQKSARQALGRARAAIHGGQLALGRAGFQEKLAAASGAADEKIAALAGEPDTDAFQAAEDAVEELASVLRDGDAYAKKDRKLKKTLVARKKQVGRKRIAIETKRLELAQVSARAKVKSGDLEQADAALDALSVAIEATKTPAKKDRGLKRLRSKAVKESKRLRGKIAQVHAEAVFGDHRSRVEQAKAQVKEALGEEGDGSSAEEAIDRLESVIAEGKAFGKKNKGYGKYLATARRYAKSQQAVLRKRTMEAEVGSNRDQLKAASAELAKSMAALKKGADEETLTAATDQADRMQSLLDEGAPLGKKYRAYHKFLAAKGKKLSVYRKQIAKRGKKKSGRKAHKGKKRRRRSRRRS